MQPPAFVGDESVVIIGQHLNTPPVGPSWHTPGLTSGLEVLILRLLEAVGQLVAHFSQGTINVS